MTSPDVVTMFAFVVYRYKVQLYSQQTDTTIDCRSGLEGADSHKTYPSRMMVAAASQSPSHEQYIDRWPVRHKI